LKKFKIAYCHAPGGKYNLEAPIPFLKKLADGYLDKYKATGDWTDILKVTSKQKKLKKYILH